MARQSRSFSGSCSGAAAGEGGLPWANPLFTNPMDVLEDGGMGSPRGGLGSPRAPCSPRMSVSGIGSCGSPRASGIGSCGGSPRAPPAGYSPAVMAAADDGLSRLRGMPMRNPSRQYVQSLQRRMTTQDDDDPFAGEGDQSLFGGMWPTEMEDIMASFSALAHTAEPDSPGAAHRPFDGGAVVDSADLSFWHEGDGDDALLGAVETDHDGERTVLLCRAASASLFVLDQFQESQRLAQERTMSAGAYGLDTHANGLEFDDGVSDATDTKRSTAMGHCPTCAAAAEHVQRHDAEVEQRQAQLEQLASELKAREAQLEVQASDLSERQALLDALEAEAKERQARLAVQDLDLKGRSVQLEAHEAEVKERRALLMAQNLELQTRYQAQMKAAEAESQKLAAEREELDASKREVEARVHALMGKEYGMVKVGSSCHSFFLVQPRCQIFPHNC